MTTDQWWGNGTSGWGYVGGVCPHGTPLSARCFQCLNPAIFSPSSPLYHQGATFQLGGWKCPGCGRCWSPAVTQCLPCQPKTPATADFDIVGECAPVSEGGLCDHDDENDRVCRGGRHCSC